VNLLQHLGDALLWLRTSNPHVTTLVVALSGGRDSMVLLEACAQLRQVSGFDLKAIHINHGLSPNADSWAQHCQRACAERNIPIEVSKVCVQSGRGTGLESAARDARYEIFASLLGSADALLTAHHRQDRAETVLLNLLRGSGPRGLAGIPFHRELGAGCVLRPFTNLDGNCLQAFAEHTNLSWVIDESNSDERFSRNLVRTRIAPVLQTRWPSWDAMFARAADHCAEAETVLQQLLDEKLLTLWDREQHRINTRLLTVMPTGLQSQILQRWIWQETNSWPSYNLITAVLNDLLPARADKQPLLSWNGVELRRFRDHLYLMEPLPAAPALPPEGMLWTPGSDGQLRTCVLPANGSLRWYRRSQGGIRASLQDLRVSYRKPGQLARLAGRPRRALKKILQESHVQPWLRDRVPLVWQGDNLVWICGIGVCEGFQSEAGESAWAIDWQLPVTFDDG
jgi:tRNA(Ile)-lysidine synthase